MYFFDNKAQEGSVFKLLIGAVIGLAIFGIIYSIILTMSDQKAYLDDQVFSNKLLMAMKNPTGKDFNINDYSVPKNTSISKKGLSEKTGLGEYCIVFKNLKIPDNILHTSSEEDSSYFNFQKDYVLDFVVNCNIGEDSECPIECELRAEDRGYSKG